MTAVEGPGIEIGSIRKWLILVSVTLATTLYSTTVLVVSVILPQMQGSMSATQDQISWVVTFNILATAVVTPMTGWLEAKFGRRRVMIVGLALFTLSTLACGLANGLLPLVLFRIAQGATGAPLIPLGQAIVLDSFSRHQHRLATSVFGMGVVIGPILGPTLGGYLAEIYNWRWAFFMLAPIGALAFVMLIVMIPEKARRPGVRLDWTGFLSLSLSLVCLQLMLDRGERHDWFNSAEIVIEACLAVIFLHIFIVHSLTAKHPFLNPRLLLNWNYSLGLILVLIYGMLNFTPIILMPPMLQKLMGYPDSIIGTLLAARGAGATIGFFLAMWVGKLDPRIGMGLGFVGQAISGLYMASFDVNVTVVDVAANSFIQGICVGMIWVPLTVATFARVRSEDLAECSAVYHLLRNLGSSIFISLSVTTVIRTANVNYAELSERITPFNEVLAYSGLLGAWNVESVRGLAAVSGEIERQALMIGYINAFGLYTLASLGVLLLVILVRGRPPTSVPS